MPNLIIYYEDRIDIIDGNSYIDRTDEGNEVTYKVTSKWCEDGKEAESCVQICQFGLYIPDDNEYIPPHRIEKIKIDICKRGQNIG